MDCGSAQGTNGVEVDRQFKRRNDKGRECICSGGNSRGFNSSELVFSLLSLSSFSLNLRSLSTQPAYTEHHGIPHPRLLGHLNVTHHRHRPVSPFHRQPFSHPYPLIEYIDTDNPYQVKAKSSIPAYSSPNHRLTPGRCWV